MTRPKDDADDSELVFTCELDQPPEQVWRALTDPELLAQWLLPNDFRAEQGATFSLAPRPGEPPTVDAQVLALEPPERLSYRWRETDTRGERVESIVTFTLVPRSDGGTRLTLVHGGFVRAARQGSGPVASSAATVHTLPLERFAREPFRCAA